MRNETKREEKGFSSILQMKYMQHPVNIQLSNMGEYQSSGNKWTSIMQKKMLNTDKLKHTLKTITFNISSETIK